MKKKVDLARYGAIICLLLYVLLGVVDGIGAFVLECILMKEIHLSGIGYTILNLLPYLPFFALAGGLLVKKNPVLLTVGAALGVLTALLTGFSSLIPIIKMIVEIILEGAFSYYGLWDWVRILVYNLFPAICTPLLTIAFLTLLVLLLFGRDKLPKFLAMVLCWLPALIMVPALFSGQSQDLFSVLKWLVGYSNWLYALCSTADKILVMVMLALMFGGLLFLARTVTEDLAAVTGKMIRIVGIVGIVVFVLAAGLYVLMWVVSFFIYSWAWRIVSMLLVFLMGFGVMLIPGAVLPIRRKEPEEREMVSEEKAEPEKKAAPAPKAQPAPKQEPAPMPVSDVHDRLRQLKQMQEEGLISQEDYDIKKKQLLDL